MHMTKGCVPRKSEQSRNVLGIQDFLCPEISYKLEINTIPISHTKTNIIQTYSKKLLTHSAKVP